AFSTPSSSKPLPESALQPHGQLAVQFKHGLPLIDVPLPSRQEDCQFSLRPLSDTVGHLCDNLRREDHGLDYVSIYGKDGIRIASSTSIDHLLQFGEFRLRLNDRIYQVSVPSTYQGLEFDSDRLRRLDDLRTTVASLHSSLCVDEFKLARERKILLKLETAESLLRPLQEEKVKIEQECELHTERCMWGGFAVMGVQMGLFARLTWYEYSWDIMEPVTYFATYSTVVATFGYYLYTRQSFEYTSVRDRVYTKQFYRRALKRNFDVERYNRLVTEVEELRKQLSRIRDPLFQHLPVSYLSNLEDELSERANPK
ncbi:unnamed protein product, partial [Caenorhabditis auriculariae]